MALVTVAYIKQDWLPITGSTQDTLLTQLIAEAGAVIAKLCHQPIEQTTETFEFRRWDVRVDEMGSYYRLSRTVPVTFSSLAYRDKVTDNYATITDTTGIAVDGGKLYADYSHTQYKATVQSGYTTIPEDIKKACGMLVYDTYHAGGVGDGTANKSQTSRSQGSGTGTTTTTNVIKSVSPAVEKLLAPYMIIIV